MSAMFEPNPRLRQPVIPASIARARSSVDTGSPARETNGLSSIGAPGKADVA